MDLFAYLLSKKVTGGGEEITGSGTSVSLSNTAPNNPINLSLASSELTQDGTPSPSSPQTIHSITGNNTITIANSDNTETQNASLNLKSKNLLKLTNGVYSNNGITYIVNNNKVIINGTATSYSSVSIPINNIKLLGQYTLGLSTIEGNITEVSSPLTNYVDILAGSSVLMELKPKQRSNIQYTYSEEKTANYLKLSCSSGVVCNNFSYYIQIEEGGKATDYQPYFEPLEYCKIGNYSDTFVKTSGKNLVNIYQTFQAGTTYLNNGITYTINDNGTITVNGTATAQSNFYVFDNQNIALESGTYTNYGFRTDSKIMFGLGLGSDDGTKYMNAFEGIAKQTMSNPVIKYMVIRVANGVSVVNQIVKPMLVKGDYSTSTFPEFEPYGVDEWWLKKNINKTNIDTTNLGTVTNYTNIDYASYAKPTDFAGYNSYDSINILSNKLIDMPMATAGWDTENNINKISGNANKNYWWIGFAKNTSLSDMKNTLENTIIYYPLLTPTYVPLSDTLQDELNAISTGFKSYANTTNITQTNDDLPFVLSASTTSKITVDVDKSKYILLEDE